MRMRHPDRRVCVYAVRPSAVRDIVLVKGEFGDAGTDVGDRRRNRSRDMSGRILLLWARLEQHDVASGHPLIQLIRCYRLETVAIVQEVGQKPGCLGQVVLRGLTQGQHQAGDLGPGRVADGQYIPSCCHQLGPAYWESGGGRERINSALTWRWDIDDLEAMPAGNGLANVDGLCA